MKTLDFDILNIHLQEQTNMSTCVICLDKMTDKCKIKTLSCQHKYHKNCINKHIKTQFHEHSKCECPLCRKVIKLSKWKKFYKKVKKIKINYMHTRLGMVFGAAIIVIVLI